MVTFEFKETFTLRERGNIEINDLRVKPTP